MTTLFDNPDSFDDMTVRERWRELTKDARPELVASYEKWIRLNPHVYDQFSSMARRAAAQRERYSHWVIVGWMRWHSDFETTGDPYKIRNDFNGLLARQMVAERVVPDDFFELRPMGRKGRVA